MLGVRIFIYGIMFGCVSLSLLFAHFHKERPRITQNEIIDAIAVNLDHGYSQAWIDVAPIPKRKPHGYTEYERAAMDNLFKMFE